MSDVKHRIVADLRYEDEQLRADVAALRREAERGDADKDSFDDLSYRDMPDRIDSLLQRHDTLLADLAAFEQQMRNADKPNLAVAMADKEWADQIQALRTARGAKK